MIRLFITAATLLLTSTVFAATVEEIQKNWNTKFPQMAGAKISVSPIQGLYMVMTPPRVYYVDADVKYIIDGSILSVNDSLKNETAIYRRQATAMAIDALEPTMIKFSPQSKPKHVVTVFTDVDCFYCQKLHKEIDAYNKLGIEIRYLAWPRSEEGSPGYKKIESVWCSKDKKKALTIAKQGKKIEGKACNNPVKQHFTLGEMLGVRGTPAMVLETGELVSGYIPAKILSTELDKLMSPVKKVSVPATLSDALKIEE